MVLLITPQSKSDITTLRTMQLEARDAGDIVRDKALGDAIDAELDDINASNKCMIFR